MSILDVFKNKPKTEKPKAKPKVKPKVEKKPVKRETPREEPTKKETPKKKPISKTTKAWQSLMSPHVTEKATALTSKNQYVFKVFKRTNKNQIKKAVESLYNVEVNDVRIINVKPKKRKLGRIEGTKSGYKKAIISVKKGQKIEILPR